MDDFGETQHHQATESQEHMASVAATEGAADGGTNFTIVSRKPSAGVSVDIETGRGVGASPSGSQVRQRRLKTLHRTS